MADRRRKNVNLGNTVIITARFTQTNSSDLEKPDFFEVSITGDGSTLATWDSINDTDKIVAVYEEGRFQYYRVFVDTTTFYDSCNNPLVVLKGTFNTNPPQVITGHAKLITLNFDNCSF